MNFRRHKTSPRQLIVILSVTIIIGVYLVTSSVTRREDFTFLTKITLTTALPQEERYLKIIKWKRNNQTMSSWESSILSDSNRIYFHETTGHDSVNLRQLCAVESAAKENPDRSVQLFFQTDYVNVTASPLGSIMKYYPNIAVILINASDYFADTPLEGWYLRGKWRTSPYKTEHFSDYIRILTLHKGGGMYMDLDFVTLKNLDRKIFQDFVPLEDKGLLTGSSFHFHRDHPIIRKMIIYLASSYHPNEWTYSGPAMFQSIVLKYCHKFLPKPTHPSFLCPGVKIMPKRYLYPYKFADWKELFRNDIKDGEDKTSKSYAVHVYNKLSKHEPVIVGSKQIYNRIARVHCPLTYAHAVDSF